MEGEKQDVGDGECKSQLETDLFHTVKTPMSANMTVIGLVNGMIGGTCLVLPHIGLRTGWLMSICVCIVTGWISFYTAYLIILHLGKVVQIKDCILNHFNNNYKYMAVYSFTIWLSFVPPMIFYFRIICLQIEGLLGHHSNLIGPLVAAGLIVLVIIIRVKHVGEQTLAYGIISIIGYVLFLVWAQFSAPEGPKTVKTLGQPISLTATLFTAYCIHGFVAANIVKNPNRSEYFSTVRKTFFIGTSAYIFIALGAFSTPSSKVGIVNRHRYKEHPETINDFFHTGQWQNSLIEVIYMVHMVSAFPNFLIISKVRFFQMFKIEVRHRIDWHEALYIIFFVAVCYLIYLSGVHIEVMITITGSVIGYAFIVVIPVGIHFRCVFYDRSSGYIENDPEWNKEIVPNGCECENVYKNKFMLYLQTVFLVLVLIAGLGLMFFAFYNIANERYKDNP